MQAPYFYIGFVYESMPEDGKMPIEQLLHRVFVEGDTETMPPVKANFTVFVGFIAGEYISKAIVEIQIVAPSGERLLPHSPSGEVEFRHPFHPVHVRFPVENLPIEEPGVYWCNVKLNEDLKARIPFEVVYNPERQKAFDH